MCDETTVFQKLSIHMKTLILITLCLVLFAIESSAQTSIYLPVASGTVNGYGATASGRETISGGNGFEGVAEFASFNSASDNLILLELTPAALPLNLDSIDVYGYDEADGQLTGSDYNEGTYLGTMTIPSNLLYNQYVSFDVTAFVQSLSGSFFGFNLRTSETIAGTDSFDAELYAVPEPSVFALVGFAIGLFFLKPRIILPLKTQDSARFA